MSDRFKKVLDRSSPEIKRRIKKSFQISDQILDILEEKKITQKQLADKLGKSESEVSKWMKGDHNFTIETIVKIEIALGETIIDTPNNLRKELFIHDYVSNSRKNFAVPIKDWVNPLVTVYNRSNPGDKRISNICYPEMKPFKTTSLNRTLEVPVKTES